MWKPNLFLGKIVIIVLYVTLITEVLDADVMTFFFNNRFLEQELRHLLQQNLEGS